MVVPVPTPFAQIPQAGVFSVDLKIYYMKYTPSDAINLATGELNNAINPAFMATYFPNASLQLT